LPLGLSRTYKTQHDPVAVRAFISEQRRATTVACENSYMLMVEYALFQGLAQDSHNCQQLSWTLVTSDGEEIPKRSYMAGQLCECTKPKKLSEFVGGLSEDNTNSSHFANILST
jgi:hypothetical protein